VVLLYAAEWDSEESGRRYFAAYARCSRKSGRRCRWLSETADSVTGPATTDVSSSAAKAPIVTSVEGLDTAID